MALTCTCSVGESFSSRGRILEAMHHHALRMVNFRYGPWMVCWATLSARGYDRSVGRMVGRNQISTGSDASKGSRGTYRIGDNHIALGVDSLSTAVHEAIHALQDIRAIHHVAAEAEAVATLGQVVFAHFAKESVPQSGRYAVAKQVAERLGMFRYPGRLVLVREQDLEPLVQAVVSGGYPGSDQRDYGFDGVPGDSSYAIPRPRPGIRFGK